MPARRPRTLISTLLRGLLGFLGALAIVLGFVYYQWDVRPLALGQSVEFEVKQGDGGHAIAREIERAGGAVSETAFVLAVRATGTAHSFKPGIYRVDQGMTLKALIGRLARGEMLRTEVRFIEGWNFRQIRALLEADTDLRQTLSGLDDRQVLAAIGAQETQPEGLFFPATYVVPKGTSDAAVLRLAYQTMHDRLNVVWQDRDPASPLHSPYEVLILASIVEKESAVEGDRAQVAAVLSNRLRIGMRLQADPTVIYGIGPSFDGDLHKRDLTTDTPYNTYTRTGLPPTPIAMPGESALLAVVHPPATDALYFVSRGDGSSEFSRTLREHNRAVAKYQRGKAE
jgi:UPF0755 protein